MSLRGCVAAISPAGLPLLQFERLGVVQMIYIDPPFGVKSGTNFQSFVRKRGVSNDGAVLAGEPR